MKLRSLVLTLLSVFLLTGCAEEKTEVAPESFTVTFNGNGGTYVTGKQIQVVYSADEIKPPTYKRDGYDFDSWNMNLSTINESTTVKALWSIIDYKIDYYLNEDETNSLLNPSHYNARTFLCLEPAIKQGYTFMYWQLKDTNEVISIIDGSSMKRDISLAPVFKADYYSITYNLDNGSFEDDAPDKYCHLYSVSIPNPVKTGYTFMGWTGAGFNNQKDITIPQGTYGDIVLNAIFVANRYNISFDSNGGTTFDDITIDYDSIMLLPTPEKVGYTFSGWYYNDTKVTSDTAYNFTEDIVLTAKWSINNYYVYRMIGYGNGSHSGSGTKFTIEEELYIGPYSATGYDFMGWYFSNDPSNLFQEYTVPVGTHENIYLYTDLVAQKYHIYFDLQGGEMSYTSLEVTYSKYYTMPTPTRTYYTFQGWYDSDNVQYTRFYYRSTEDLYLTARWSFNGVASINYDLDGGVNNPSNPTSYSPGDGDVTLLNPTKEGYTFVGWSCDGVMMNPPILNEATSICLWKANWAATLHNLSVISESSEKGTASIVSGNGYSFETITIKATPTSGHVFRGWYVNNEFISSSETYSFEMPNSDYFIYAYFYTQAEYDVYCEDNWGLSPVISSDGKTVTYGLYPQVVVEDTTLISQLENLTLKDINGWYFYNGYYYTSTNAVIHESGYKFDSGTSIVSGQKYWFRCLPITWSVLSKSGTQYYLLANGSLDVTKYYSSTSSRTINGSTVYPNNYQHSDIRAWLNDDFFNTAFALNNSHVASSTVNNSASTTASTSNRYVCSNTVDNVFLPSYSDYRNTSYGFSTTTSYTDLRVAPVSDYAKCRKSYLDSTKKSGHYWTRSPYYSNSSNVHYVSHKGDFYYYSVTATDISVRPAIMFNV